MARHIKLVERLHYIKQIELLTLTAFDSQAIDGTAWAAFGAAADDRRKGAGDCVSDRFETGRCLIGSTQCFAYKRTIAGRRGRGGRRRRRGCLVCLETDGG